MNLKTKKPVHIRLLSALFMAGLPFSHAQQLDASAEQLSVVQAYTLLVSSEAADDHRKAYYSLLQNYQQGDAAAKSDIEGKIISILSSPVVHNENWGNPSTPRNLMCFLAGELKLAAAIPKLIELLAPLPGERNIRRTDLLDEYTPEHYPVPRSAEALCKIGKPAEQPLRDILPSVTDIRKKSFINYILNAVSKQGGTSL